MATITWAGKSGNWNTGSLWIGTVVPGASDLAVITASPAADTILLNDTRTVAGVTLNDVNAALQLTGDLSLNGQTLDAQAGTLIVAGTLSNGTLAQDGAAIKWSSVNPVTNAVAAPELDFVTVTGTLDLSGQSATLQVTGLAQSGAPNIKIGAGSELLVLDPETFTGETIDLAGGALISDASDPNNGTIAIGFGTEVLQDTPSTTAQIGANVISSLVGLGSVLNRGTIIANAGTLILDAVGGAFTSPFHLGAFTNEGLIEIGAGATVVDSTNATFAGLGSIVNNGGLLDLKGMLDNSNATIDVGTSGAFTNLKLDGTVTGGAIIEDGGSLAIGSASLQGVAVTGTGAAFSMVTIGKGTSFNPGSNAGFTLTAQQAGYGFFYLDDGAVLSNARIAYGGTQYQVNITAVGAAAPVVTLDSSTTLDVGAGQVLRLDAGTGGTMINNAVINVAAGGQLDFVNAATYVGGGTINVVPGSTVQFTGDIGLNAITNVVGTGATLGNLGNLDLGGGTISTTGNANFALFENGGQITDGTVITNATENPNLGVIYNATLVLAGGVTPVKSVSVNNATIRGALQLEANGEIDVYGDLNLENEAGTGPGVLILDQQPVLYVLGSATSVQFKQSVTVSNATVLLSGVTPAAETAAFSSMSDLEVQGDNTVTLAPSVLIVATTVNGPIGILGGPGYFVNEGTIAIVPGADLVLGPYGPTPFGSPILEDFINKGLITIAAGATLDVATQSSILALGSIYGPGGLVRLDTPDSGPNNYDNTGNTLTVGGPTGAPDLEIDATSITGGTIVNAGGQFTGISGTLNTVTYVGSLDLVSGTDLYGNFGVGYLTFNGGTLDSQNVTVGAGSTLNLGADQSFTGATISLSGELADPGHTLSFDANTSVNVTASYITAGHLLNAGTITIGPGDELQLNDAGATASPEPFESGTIAISQGTLYANVLDSGQTLDLGPQSSVNISRFDPGSQVVFQAPNTLDINQGAATNGSFSGFGVGDTIALTGYQDGPFAQLIFGNDGTPHGADATITLGYDGQTLSVIRGGTLTIATLTVGAGYDINGFTVTPVGDPSVLVSGYNVTYAPPGQPLPAGPTIAGTQANQPTDDETPITPFGAVVLTDPNAGAIVTATITFPTYNGTLSAPSGGTLEAGRGIWVDTGSAAAVQAAMRGLVFTPLPHEAAPGTVVSSSFSVTLSDQFASVTDSTTSVQATPVEDPILISGVIPLEYASDNSGAGQPFKTIALSDPDNATFTATATLSSTTLASFGTTYNAKISPSGVYSTTGSLNTVQTALQNLIIYAAPLGLPTGQSATATVTLAITDGVSQTAGASSELVIVASGTADAAGLQIIGTTPGQATSDQVAINPFAGAILVDKSIGATDTLTITLSNPADGTLSDVLGGVTNGATFTASGTVDSVGFVDAVDNAMAALVFTPTRGQVPFGQSVTTGFTATASNNFGSTTDALTSVIATAAGGQLSIAGAQANQEFTDVTAALPFASVTINDSQLPPVETATASLSNPSSGTLLAENGGSVGVDGVFRVSGSLAQVQAALRALGFAPAGTGAGNVVTSGVTISVADGTLNATDTTTSLIVIGSGAAGTITPNPAVAGLTSSGPALTTGTSANSFVLNLGTVLIGATVAPVTLDALNSAIGTADALSGTFSIDDPGGFLNGGFAGFATLAAGGTSAAGSITLDTGSAGTFSETITLAPTDLNGGPGSALASQTVTVDAVVAAVTPAPAVEVLNFSGTILLPNVRVGSVDRQAISVSNGATSPADTLSVTPAASGLATASGTISGLAAAGTDASSILLGIDTTAAGTRAGSVTLNGNSVDSGGTATALASPPVVSVSGNVYRTASGTIMPVASIVHVGDPGTVSITVGNTAAADGFSENLLASLAGVTGGIDIAAAGPTAGIAAGSSDASSLKIDFSTTAAGTISGTATVDLTSDGGTGVVGIDGLGTIALTPQAVPVAITVDNYANPVFEDVSAAGTFTPGATAYTLDLGTITQGSGPFTVDLGVLNSTSGPSDALTGSLTAIGSSAFINSGLASVGTLAAGQADLAPAITLDTGSVGTFSEMITLAGTGSNAGGYSAALPNQTLTVTGTVAASIGTVSVPPIAPAIAAIAPGGTIDFFDLHVGGLARETPDISNTASAGAASLDGAVASVSGNATASGSFSGLAPGGENASAITAGIDTSAVGVRSGTVTFAFVSDGGSLGSTPLANQDIVFTGTVYREAAAALLPLNAIVHVGDPGTLFLPVSNSDPADNYSESLIATLIGASGGLGVASPGPTDDIAAGQTNTNTLALAFSTAQSGTVAGNATVGLISDGRTIDALGTTTLTAQVVPVNITVDNYAAFALSSNGSLTSTGADAYVLNLGTATQGAGALSAALEVSNSATGTADWLNGSATVSGSGQFSNPGLGSFSKIDAGASVVAGDVSLSTGQTGVFSETITLTPVDANAGGYSDALTPRTITVTGTIVPGTASGDVHMVTFDGLHYDFQAIGDFVLTRSTVPGDPFQIQIETVADPSIKAVSVTSQAAAQVGTDVVSFAAGRSSIVWVDGAPDTALSAANPVQDLAGGKLEEPAPGQFTLTWASGEVLNITDTGPYLNSAVSLPASDGPGSMQGLLGGDSGQVNDFQRADGSVIPQPLSESEVLGAFANAWRADSLLDASPMSFLYTDAATGQTVLQATAAGQVLAGGQGVDVLSDADGFGVTFLGSLSDLANQTISGFSAKDVIDVSDLDSATASVGYDGSNVGGVLTVSDGVHNGDIHLAGVVGGGHFQIASDTHGGTLITLT